MAMQGPVANENLVKMPEVAFFLLSSKLFFTLGNLVSFAKQVPAVHRIQHHPQRLAGQCCCHRQQSRNCVHWFSESRAHRCDIKGLGSGSNGGTKFASKESSSSISNISNRHELRWLDSCCGPEDQRNASHPALFGCIVLDSSM